MGNKTHQNNHIALRVTNEHIIIHHGYKMSL